MAGYEGLWEEGYSLLNHFISELGHYGASRLAVVFNCGLMVASVLLGWFGWGFAGQFRGWQRIVIATLAMATSVFCFLVGLIPMDYLYPHLKVALVFFYSALTMVFFTTVVTLISRQPVLPRWTVAIGVVVAACFVGFLAAPTDIIRAWIAQPEGFIRPRAWALCMLEWACFFSIIVWLVVASGVMLRRKG
jgi:hypothetical membrane protein